MRWTTLTGNLGSLAYYYSHADGGHGCRWEKQSRRWLWVEEPKRKQIKPRGGTEQWTCWRGIFTSQSNGKIRVGGDEAMEPNLESLGKRRGGEWSEGHGNIVVYKYLYYYYCYYCCVGRWRERMWEVGVDGDDGEEWYVEVDFWRWVWWWWGGGLIYYF